MVKALLASGRERELLRMLSDSLAEIEMSALDWYEFCRGPRLPQQEGVARSFLEADGVVDFDESIARRASHIFRRLGRPRRRAADIAIAAVAISREARLLTGSVRDYSGIEELLIGG